MGVDISRIVARKEISLSELQGKIVGIDAYNALYQFLSSIRGPFGEPLKDSHGNITSHLTGLFYRTVSMMEKGLKPVFVFDGKPLERKEKTVQQRHAVRSEAKEKLEKAKKELDEEAARKYARQAVSLSKEVIESGRELLGFMGLPCVQAENDAEAQLSVMQEKKDVDVVVSQDYDALLFGTERLVRNVALSGRRKLPGRNIFIDIKPEEISLSRTLDELKISRQKLVWIGMLVGTDFNEKIPGIGPKNALKLVQENNSFEEILEKKGVTPDYDYKEIQEIFLKPSFNKDYKIEFREINDEKITGFLCEKHDFNRDRIQKNLEKLKERIDFNSKQSNLSKWS